MSFAIKNSVIIKVAFSSLFVVFVLVAPMYAQATSKTPECIDQIAMQIAIPGVGHCVDNVIEYIRAIYALGVGAAGILSVAVIVFAGFGWMLAAGNQEKITHSRGQIIGALMGLFLAMFSYALLNTLNTDIVKLSITGLTNNSLTKFEQSSNATGMVCPSAQNVPCGLTNTYFDPRIAGEPLTCMGTYCDLQLSTSPNSFVCKITSNDDRALASGTCVDKWEVDTTASKTSVTFYTVDTTASCGAFEFDGTPTSEEIGKDCDEYSFSTGNTCFYVDKVYSKDEKVVSNQTNALGKYRDGSPLVSYNQAVNCPDAFVDQYITALVKKLNPPQ